MRTAAKFVTAALGPHVIVIYKAELKIKGLI
jgi:hypothetical protein